MTTTSAAPRHRSRTALLATGAMLLAGMGTAGLMPGAAAAAAAGCTVEYTVTNQWNSGFTSSVTVTNTGDPLSTWKLEWVYAGGQRVTQGWNADISQSGTAVTAANPSWGGSLGTGAAATFGFNGTHTGSNPEPAAFRLNGVLCNDGGPGDPGDPGDPPPGERVDNPYAGARVYVNPEWAAKAAAEPGGSRVAGQPTGVWMDRTAAIAGVGGTMGLRDHLDEALRQAGTGGDPFVVQVVIYNLPGRDCAALASNGELGPTELDKYKTQYIDPIAAIFADPKYASLRIVTTIEIDSLPNLITNVAPRPTATPQCDVMKANGNYVKGVGYALGKLGDVGNVYNYIDAGHHGWIGWEDNFAPSAQLMFQAANAEGATVADVHGFIANTANYSALKEENFRITDVVAGRPVREASKWIDWNNYADELSFAQAFRRQAVTAGFKSDIGMLIDTSRNGWGGAARPAGPGPTTSADAYVDGGRFDRRIHLGNWCNQSGAGLGERPKASPEPGIDAYVWMKPPGESDGSSSEIPNDEGKGFDRMCDPTYQGNPRNQSSPSGALPNAPVSGHWFSAQFQELMRNAHPPLG
ncbi:glycoside hydrolase family 6 protein [Streptomyces sp. 549]|uniref:glycoside hydrolase family 6 protein n=1 Tax=Streptomyces sp. 549 TaxID=3049076 RepID=UPI0024C3EAC5|nr:glycoside hydrolase family 6 protein [Streptomyces sp. 549]MDK1475843.1 glycoside hydrolase family 6 protein [Streptomyces sp. 549]